jgi:LPXTG-motif cell wall-anchored protein
VGSMKQKVLVAAVGVLLSAGAAGPASAAGQYPGQVAPREQVGGAVVERPQAAPARQAPRGATLPVTGGDVVALAVVGGGAVAAGGVLLASRRRLQS